MTDLEKCEILYAMLSDANDTIRMEAEDVAQSRWDTRDARDAVCHKDGLHSLLERVGERLHDLEHAGLLAEAESLQRKVNELAGSRNNE